MTSSAGSALRPSPTATACSSACARPPPDRVDAAVDTVGTDEAVDVSLALVADRGRIATIAAFGRAADAGIRLLGGGPGADPGDEIRAAARLELVDLAEAGRLRVWA